MRVVDPFCVHRVSLLKKTELQDFLKMEPLVVAMQNLCVNTRKAHEAMDKS